MYNHFHPRIDPALQLQHPNSRHSGVRDRGFLSGVPWFAASKHCSYWTLLRTIHLPDLRLDSRICMLFSLAIVGSLTAGFVSGVSWFAASKHCSYWTLPRTIHFLGRHLDSREPLLRLPPILSALHPLSIISISDTNYRSRTLILYNSAPIIIGV